MEFTNGIGRSGERGRGHFRLSQTYLYPKYSLSLRCPLDPRPNLRRPTGGQRHEVAVLPRLSKVDGVLQRVARRMFLTSSCQNRHRVVLLSFCLRVVFILFLSSRGVLLAQQVVGSFSGNIHDSSGAAVPNATVELTSTITYTAISTSTSADGHFVLPNLQIGTYKVTVTISGFKSYETTVDINPGQSSSADIVLSVGSVSETIEVSSRGGSSNTSSTVSNKPAPVWNAWTETFAPALEFRPNSSLRPQTDYNLVLDLSALSYGEAAGLYSQKAGKDLQAWLKSVKTPSAYLDVLIVPDQFAFAPQREGEKSKQLSIDLRKAAKAQRMTFRIKGQPFDTLRRDKNPQFVFGRIVARVTTTSRLGLASIAIMIWSNGKPIDELTIPVCITDGSLPCSSRGQVAVTLKGIDSLRIAATANSSLFPDAAIHLIELDPSHLIGVFKCNSCTDPKDRPFKTWEISGTAAQLSTYLTATNLADFENATTDADYLQHAEELYIKLFRDGSTGELAATEADFRRFILQNARSGTTVAPSIFVRLLPGSSQPLFLVPLGLMSPPGTKLYIGNHFRIETPFESQSYNAAAACVSQWTLLVPPAALEPVSADSPVLSDPMYLVRQPFESWITSFSNWGGHTTIDTDLTTFSTWLRDSGAKAKSDGIIILSHHDADRIYFYDGKGDIESANVLNTSRARHWLF